MFGNMPFESQKACFWVFVKFKSLLNIPIFNNKIHFNNYITAFFVNFKGKDLHFEILKKENVTISFVYHSEKLSK